MEPQTLLTYPVRPDWETHRLTVTLTATVTESVTQSVSIEHISVLLLQLAIRKSGHTHGRDCECEGRIFTQLLTACTVLYL